MMISIDNRQHTLIKSVKSNDELSVIERRITRYETANSEVSLPVVSLTIPPRNVLILAYTIKQISGYNSVI
jgi:hypothetical protein